MLLTKKRSINAQNGHERGNGLRLKQGVRIHGIRPELLLALQISESVYREFDTELIVTSVIDGKHSAGSLHYTGSAVDLRIRHLPQNQVETVRDEIAERLGSDFDAVLESDHIHIEFQPKAAYGKN